MIEDFLESLRHRGYSPATVRISKTWLEHFRARHHGSLSELKAAELTRYHQSLHWEPGPSGKLYSENTVNQAVGVLKSYFRWCLEQGHLKVCPASHLVTRRPPAKERTLLTPSQARLVLGLPDLRTPLGLRDRAILSLFIEEQASPGSLSRLDLDDFQVDTGAILLKGRKRRIISLGEGLQTDLERYLRLGRQGQADAKETAFFLGSHGKRMTGSAFLAILKTYCGKAGIPRPSFSS